MFIGGATCEQTDIEIESEDSVKRWRSICVEGPVSNFITLEKMQNYISNVKTKSTIQLMVIHISTEFVLIII